MDDLKNSSESNENEEKEFYNLWNINPKRIEL